MDKLVSVVLPVYNGSDFLQQTIESIVAQTYRDFEVIVVDDGSTDNSAEIVQKYGDERFIILQRESNLGLVRALNLGVKKASTDLISRIDADDLMVPERLLTQVQFMADNTDIDICGSYFDYINEVGRSTGGALAFPITHRAVKASFQHFTAIGHPTVIFRKSSIIRDFGREDIYDEEFKHAEDLALWLECLTFGLNFANIPQVLTHYRVHGEQRSTAEAQICEDYTKLARKRFGDWLSWSEDIDLESAVPLRNLTFKRKA